MPQEDDELIVRDIIEKDEALKAQAKEAVRSATFQNFLALVGYVLDMAGRPRTYLYQIARNLFNTVKGLWETFNEMTDTWW